MNLSKRINELLVTFIVTLFILINIYGLFAFKQKTIILSLVSLRDNFPGKEYFVSKYNSIKLNCFHENPIPGRIIIGKDGWYFLGDFFEKGNSISLGLTKYNEQELELVSNKILERNSFLAKLNIKFYVAIAPNKQSVYDKYLFEGKYDTANNTQLLKIKLKNKYNFGLIDLKENLDLLKDSIQLYYKTDTHWNGLGAFIGFSRICSEIRKDFPEFSPWKIEDYSIKKAPPFQLDLTALLKVPVLEEGLILEPKFSPTGIRKASVLQIPYNFIFDKSWYEYRLENTKKRLKILVFRDSFSSALIDYFKESFGSAILLWDFNFNKQLIIDEKPDIVLYLVSERFVDNAFIK